MMMLNISSLTDFKSVMRTNGCPLLPLMGKEVPVILKLSWFANADAHDRSDALLNAAQHVSAA